jgi:hypothetical protein
MVVVGPVDSCALGGGRILGRLRDLWTRSGAPSSSSSSLSSTRSTQQRFGARAPAGESGVVDEP